MIWRLPIDSKFIHQSAQYISIPWHQNGCISRLLQYIIFFPSNSMRYYRYNAKNTEIYCPNLWSITSYKNWGVSSFGNMEGESRMPLVEYRSFSTLSSLTGKHNQSYDFPMTTQFSRSFSALESTNGETASLSIAKLIRENNKETWKKIGYEPGDCLC